MTKTLEMTFKTTAGKDVTFNISEPKNNLTLTEVQTAAAACISANIFQNVNGDLTAFEKAQIREVTITALA